MKESEDLSIWRSPQQVSLFISHQFIYLFFFLKNFRGNIFLSSITLEKDLNL